MTQALDWNFGKFLEWRTYLPCENRPQISPLFAIKNNDCYFQFNRIGYSRYYNLCLKPTLDSVELKPFPLTIYFTYNESDYPYSYRVKFSGSRAPFFSFPESFITNKKTLNLSNGLSVLFLFAFDQNVELCLHSERKADEKSIQTDLNIFEVDEKSTQADFMNLNNVDDFDKLLKTSDYSDVQLLCNGGNIPAHKVILAARSKTFSDMLQNSSEESKKGLIDLIATEKSVMELCLEFIYKGQISNLPIDKASNLYSLGHILKMSSLTKKCVDLLISNLCEENYITYLELAAEYDDNYFKSCIVDYVSDHIQLLKTERWMKFSEEHMKSAIEVYKKCMHKLI